MNLALNNLFQAKFINEDDDEEKVDFFKANFGRESDWGGRVELVDAEAF